MKMSFKKVNSLMIPKIFYLNLTELKTEVSIDSYLQISKSNFKKWFI